MSASELELCVCGHARAEHWNTTGGMGTGECPHDCDCLVFRSAAQPVDIYGQPICGKTWDRDMTCQHDPGHKGEHCAIPYERGPYHPARLGKPAPADAAPVPDFIANARGLEPEEQAAIYSDVPGLYDGKPARTEFGARLREHRARVEASGETGLPLDECGRGSCCERTERETVARIAARLAACRFDHRGFGKMWAYAALDRLLADLEREGVRRG